MCQWFDVNPLKRAFYAACNSIFMHDSCIDGIAFNALLTLQETYRALVCFYECCACLSLNNRHIAELLNSWNIVIRRIFSYDKYVVKAVLFGLVWFNVKQLIMHRQSSIKVI